MPRSADSSRRKLWLARIQRHSQCDLTVAQFCRREGISAPSFYQWKKKLTSDGAAAQVAAPRFVPVRVADPVPAVPATLRLPGGASIELPSTLGPERLVELVAACVDATKPGTDGESVQ
jgi:hypothetical protein